MGSTAVLLDLPFAYHTAREPGIGDEDEDDAAACFSSHRYSLQTTWMMRPTVRAVQNPDLNIIIIFSRLILDEIFLMKNPMIACRVIPISYSGKKIIVQNSDPEPVRKKKTGFWTAVIIGLSVENVRHKFKSGLLDMNPKYMAQLFALVRLEAPRS